MRETLISILALLALAPLVKTSDDGKDGFNLYKDYLRARSDDIEGPGAAERMLYFYRAPLYPGLLPVVEQDYRKRTGNAFKNHMLSKEFWADDAGDGLRKRSSKTAISLIMQGKHHPYFVHKLVVCKELVSMIGLHLYYRSPGPRPREPENTFLGRETLLSLRQKGNVVIALKALWETTPSL